MESAVFDSTDIRRTSKKLGLSTDASYRFERGIDAGMTERAIERAAQLIIEIAGGKIVSEVIRVGNARTETTLSTEYNKINQLTGLSLTKDEINQILERLGFSINQEQCQIPSWRHDIGIWQDLSEEVARIIGYDRIPKHALPESEAPERSTFHKKEMIKDYLVTLGFSEVYNYPFLSEKELRIGHFEPSSLLEVSNPAQSENKYLRSTLVPGLLKSISKNPVFDPVLIFEIGNTFSINAENTMLGIAASGKNAKKIIHQAVSMLTDLCEQSEKVIAVQEIAGEELAKHKIRKPAVYIIETNLSTLLSSIDTHSIKLKNETHKVHYRPVSPYPVVSRDIAFIIDSSVSTELVANTIYNTSEYIILAELFDEFVSDKFGNNKKSLAYHLYLQHPSRTLTDIEAENVLSNLVSKLANKYQIKIRD
ncbi:MAG: Phenylalanine--tRNA ligase beta subunit [bacterium ADurb.Bin400]|nr:MAG: Phenylalanine--tRNA ligase beta subunit [bacterium ADurb.Bin400]